MGGAGEVQKKNSRKGKLNEKNSCTPINPKKHSCYGLKKIHTGNLITKKNSCGSKIPLPPHNLSNGPSLDCNEQLDISYIINIIVQVMINVEETNLGPILESLKLK